MEKLNKLSIFLLAISIFSGQYSVVRLFNFLPKDYNFNIKFIIISITSLYAITTLIDKKKLKINNDYVIFFSLFLIFISYFIYNNISIGYAPTKYYNALQFLFLILQTLIIIVIINSYFNLHLVLKFMLGIGVVLAIIGFLRVGSQEVNGSKWIAVGSVISHYRIEFICAIISTYFIGINQKSNIKILFYITFIISSVSVFYTFSKISFIAYIVVFGLYIFDLISKKKYLQFRIISLLIIISLTLFSLQYTTLFERFNAVLSSQEISTNASSAASSAASSVRSENPELSVRVYQNKLLLPNIYENYSNLDANKLSDLDNRRLAAVHNIFENIDCSTKKGLSFNLCLVAIDRLIFFSDPTSRLRMLIESWKLFNSSPVIGVGVGNFRYLELNPYGEGAVDKYTHPHNIFAEILATGGLVGLLLCCISLLYIFILYRRYDSNEIINLFKYYSLFLIISSLVAGDIFDFIQIWVINVLILNVINFPKNDLQQ